MITIQLPHDHFHAGKRFKKGEEYTFTEEEYDWFMHATLGNREKHIATMAERVGTPEWAAKTMADAKAAKLSERDEGDDEEEELE